MTICKIDKGCYNTSRRRAGTQSWLNSSGREGGNEGRRGRWGGGEGGKGGGGLGRLMRHMNLNKSTPSHWKGIDAKQNTNTHTHIQARTPTCTHTLTPACLICVSLSLGIICLTPLCYFFSFFATYHFSHHLTHLWMIPNARLGRLIDCMCQCVCLCVCVCDYSLYYMSCCGPALSPLPSPALSLSLCVSVTAVVAH